jgi:hypothetical protein
VVDFFPVYLRQSKSIAVAERKSAKLSRRYWPATVSRETFSVGEAV